MSDEPGEDDLAERQRGGVSDAQREDESPGSGVDDREGDAPEPMEPA